MESRYEALTTRQLVLAVQSEAMELERLKKDKKASTKKMIRRSQELMELRLVCSNRLKNLDRNLPDFFPIGSQCMIHSPDHPQLIRTCSVIGHDEGQVRVLVQGGAPDIFIEAKVEPKFLTLMYIRHKY